MLTQAPESGKTNTEPTKEAITDPKVAPATVVTEPPKVDAAATVIDPKKEPEGAPKVEPKFDLKLPEGSPLAAESVEKMVARAKELNLTPEQAQAELSKESDLVKSFVEGEKQKMTNQVNSWVEESKKDPEVGGEKFGQNAEIAKRVVNRFGTEEFKKALNESGLGNHPELVRVFVRIGRAMSDDQLVLPSGNPTAPRSPAEVLYGNSTETKEK